MFSIDFTEEPLEYPYDDIAIPAAPGLLILGESTESFLANLSIWNKSAYKSHWRRELGALIEGNPKIALIVSLNDPKAASSMEIWRLYRQADLVYFQNQLLSYTELPQGFDVSAISAFVKNRALTEEGNRISEWLVPLADVRTFVINGPSY